MPLYLNSQTIGEFKKALKSYSLAQLQILKPQIDAHYNALIIRRETLDLELKNLNSRYQENKEALNALLRDSTQEKRPIPIEGTLSYVDSIATLLKNIEKEEAAIPPIIKDIDLTRQEIRIIELIIREKRANESLISEVTDHDQRQLITVSAA